RAPRAKLAESLAGMDSVRPTAGLRPRGRHRLELRTRRAGPDRGTPELAEGPPAPQHPPARRASAPRRRPRRAPVVCVARRAGPLELPGERCGLGASAALPKVEGPQSGT